MVAIAGNHSSALRDSACLQQKRSARADCLWNSSASAVGRVFLFHRGGVSLSPRLFCFTAGAAPNLQRNQEKRRKMNFTTILLTLSCVIGIAIGQILFKQAALAISTPVTLHGMLANIWIWLSLSLYGATTLLWIWVLRQAPLHLAYPFMGLAFLLVPVFARIFLNEPLSLQTIGGGILIMLGIALASAGAHH